MEISNKHLIVYNLLEQLCQNMCGPNYKDKFKNTLDYLLDANARMGKMLDYDDAFLITQVTRAIPRNKQYLMPHYLEFHRKLKTCTTLSERCGMLTFLLTFLEFEQISDEFEPHQSAMLMQLLKLRYDVARCRKTVEMHIGAITESSPTLPASNAGSMPLPETQNIPSNPQTSMPEEKMKEIQLMEDLVQNVIYSFIGIQGKYLKKDVVTGEFRLTSTPKTITIPQGCMMLRLAEMGTLHDQVQIFANTTSGRCALGLMGQAFVGALQTEITRYYGLVAVLQDQFRLNTVEKNLTPGESMTLIRLQFWSYLPRQRLEWVARIGEACEEKKGGALASTIHSFVDNGDPLVKDLTNEFLVAVCRPLMRMMVRWILDGEIVDPHGEFFIECLSEISADKLWHEMYRVRTSMLPEFISSSMSHKILVTGKSINFLREICKDNIPIKERDQLKQCLQKNTDSIFAKVPDTELHSMIEKVYLNTSKRVLDIMKGPHKLLEHFVAIKKFLLLGQGDFISSLLEQLRPELDKPAKELLRCDLSSILDTAIRLTNVQYMDPDILNLLDIRLLTPHEGDTGWDIFSLQYSVQGPVQTILEKSMHNYQIIFKPLWQMKHIQQMLSTKIWQQQMSSYKLLRSMHFEINPILYLLNLHTSEMIHFIQEMQYYILFEVIECAWIDFEKKAQSAKTLDEILGAHDELLDIIKVGAFLDRDSDIIREYLEDVYQSIFQLETWQDKFLGECLKEFETRNIWKRDTEMYEAQDNWRMSAELYLERQEELDLFEISLNTHHRTLEKIGNNYESVVGRFLLTLNSNINPNLQLLGIRLDFNEYYKKRDQRLDVPLTFEHLRNKSMTTSRTSIN